MVRQWTIIPVLIPLVRMPHGRPNPHSHRLPSSVGVRRLWQIFEIKAPHLIGEAWVPDTMTYWEVTVSWLWVDNYSLRRARTG